MSSQKKTLLTYQNIEDQLLLPALRSLLKLDINLLNQSLREECINHRFAVHLEECLRSLRTGIMYAVDIEYDRKVDVRKIVRVDDVEIKARPDIIIHERKTQSYNLLVIEAKKHAISLHDEMKIRGLLNRDYHYDFGVLLSYGFPKRAYVRYVLLRRIPHNNIQSKIVWFYGNGNTVIRKDWHHFEPRNSSTSHN